MLQSPPLKHNFGYQLPFHFPIALQSEILSAIREQLENKLPCVLYGEALHHVHGVPSAGCNSDAERCDRNSFFAGVTVFHSFPSYLMRKLKFFLNLSSALYVRIFAPLSVMSRMKAISLKSLSSKKRNSSTCSISVGSSFK